MKRITLILTLALFTTNLFAQFETEIKLGTSTYSGKVISMPNSSVFYAQVSFGYRFFNQKRITLIPQVFINKSGFVLQDVTFGTPSPTGLFGTTDITYRLYKVGLNISAEIKLLNLSKKTNFYITPSIAYHRIGYSERIPSNTDFSPKKENSNIRENFIVDWGIINGGIELGVKLQKFKFGLSYEDVLNKGNSVNDSFVINNTFSLSVSYLFGKTTE